MADRLVNEGIRWGLLLIWFISNFITWLVVFFKYARDAAFYYTFYLIGYGLPIARGSAACINLNSMLILLPVCRNLISFFRGSCETNRYYRRSLRRQLDKNITFHKLLAYTIAFFMILHIASHCFNFQYLYDASQLTSSDDDVLAYRLTSLPRTKNSWLNPVDQFSESPYAGLGVIIQVLSTTAGLTGVVLTTAYILMFTSATKIMRQHYFENFWMTHHLFIIYYAMLLSHGVQGIVRRQINLQDHKPSLCKDIPNEWGDGTDCPLPKFGAGEPSSWKWCVFPIVMYFLERCIRFYRTSHTVTITKVVSHPSNVVELQMKREGFHMMPGQYVFLLCPKISRYQWHPFTLTSAPDEDHFSVHIRLVGDWTKALAEAVGADKGEMRPAQLPRMSVDGPFGTASIDIFQYEVGVCVAAGIGVTPFASILKSIWFKVQRQDQDLKLNKVYFFWICPDFGAFEWFQEMLSQLENDLVEIGKTDFLEYHIYLSRGWSTDQAKNIYMKEEEEIDAVTGLRQKTNYGRPKWDSNFKQMAQDNQGKQIGVFFCGPKPLSSVLHKNCNNFTSREPGGTIFVYNKENF